MAITVSEVCGKDQRGALNQHNHSTDMSLRHVKSVVLQKARTSLIRRVITRLRTAVYSYIWQHRMASFGSKSRIDKPELIAGLKSIAIGDRVHIWQGSRIEALNPSVNHVRIRIGDHTVIHPRVHIGAVESVEIGQGVLMASSVYISDHDHDYSNPENPVIWNGLVKASPVKIGDFVWLGERVIVLKGVTIGKRSVIGAGSVVTRDIPPYCVAAGVPAKIKLLYDNQLKEWKRPS